MTHGRAGDMTFMFVSVLFASQVPRGQHGEDQMYAGVFVPNDTELEEDSTLYGKLAIFPGGRHYPSFSIAFCKQNHEKWPR